MNVANIDLCKELYELSGWGTAKEGDVWTDASGHPRYELGYLLRKLPNGTNVMYNNERSAASYEVPIGELYLYGKTPEDAACKLAIELLKKGVLTKEEQDK